MKILLASLFITIAIVFCTSFYFKEETPVQTQEYTVQPGDTLYSIAEEYGIKNWRKWSYEVCKNNDLKQGGMIHPGQIITIEVTQ